MAVIVSDVIDFAVPLCLFGINGSGGNVKICCSGHCINDLKYGNIVVGNLSIEPVSSIIWQYLALFNYVMKSFVPI